MRPKGFKHTEETKKKMKEKRKESYVTGIFRGGFKKGHKVNEKVMKHSKEMGLKNKGKKHSEEINKKKGHPGNKNPAWKGGISKEPYSFEFNDELKNIIRTRDSHRCQLCHTYKKGIKLHVHHIDYNKKNCNLSNLISLCSICHNYTQKNRKVWEIFFKNLMEKRCDI